MNDKIGKISSSPAPDNYPNMNEESSFQVTLGKDKFKSKDGKSLTELAEINRLVTNILEHTHIMVVYLDPKFNFLWVNKSYADTCKHDPSFFPGKNHFDLYPHEENQKIFSLSDIY